jgi:hypothetical protein
MHGLLVTVLQLSFFLAARGLQNVITLTSEKPVQSISATFPGTYSFCFKEPKGLKLGRVFHETQITVKADEDYDFPWFSVRGVSTDDFHGNIEAVVLRLAQVSDEEKEAHVVPIHEKKSYFRDLLSSCPNPLLSKNRSECTMTFSPFGDACVTFATERPVKLVASVKRDVNHKLSLKLVCGFVLLMLAHALSKSKIFQVNEKPTRTCRLNNKLGPFVYCFVC